MGLQFLILDAAANPVALARNAYGRWFPEVQGSAPARTLASQLDWLKAQPAMLSVDLFDVAYLSAVITFESCIALYAGRSNHVVNVVRLDPSGTYVLQSVDHLARDVQGSAEQRKALQVPISRIRDFPSN